jgi:hypothetical protein
MVAQWVRAFVEARDALQSQLDLMDRDPVFPDMNWTAPQRAEFATHLRAAIDHYEQMLKMGNGNA